MSNTNNRSPLLASVVDNSIQSLRNEKGLALILGSNSSRDGVESNTSQAESDFKNSMVVAFEIQPTDIIRIASNPKGHPKVVSTDTKNVGYFRGDGSATTKSNKPWVMTDSGLLVAVFGNDSNAQWKTETYNSYSFRHDVSFDRGPGYHQTSDGFVFAIVGKMHDGISGVSDSYIELRNKEDDIKDYIKLNSIDTKSQASRICGSGNEERIGTCCLYYNDYHYDPIAGVTFGPGDYYKCTCSKCYHCLELAKSLDMKYVFNPFVGPGSTGPRCLACEDEEFPSDCGPCDCKIGNVSDTYRILNNHDLPPSGTAKHNATYSQWWENNGQGGAFIHLTKAFSDLPSIERKIENSWYDRSDKNIKLIGIQEDGYSDTVYSLEVVGKKGEAYITGIRLISVGRYDSTPQIDMTELRKIWPKAQPDYFNVVRVPNLHEEMHQLVGKTQVMIRKKISFSDISKLTDITSFDGYAIGTISTQDGGKYFENPSKIAGGVRLTIKNDMSVTDSSGVAIPKTKTGATVSKFSFTSANNQITDTIDSSFILATQSTTGSNSYVNISNIETISTTKVNVELFAGNKDTKVKEELKFTDPNTGNIYTTISSNVPVEPTTGEKLDPSATKILNQSKTKINVPNQSNNVGINHQTVVLEVVLGTGEMKFE